MKAQLQPSLFSSFDSGDRHPVVAAAASIGCNVQRTAEKGKAAVAARPE